MAGPTTEAVNEDVKTLREDLHKVQVSLSADVHKVGLEVAELRGEFKIAKWLIGATLATAISGVLGGVWWASKINAKVDFLETRFDKLEGKIDRLIEQGRGVVRP